jgi:hypothetical protein
MLVSMLVAGGLAMPAIAAGADLGPSTSASAPQKTKDRIQQWQTVKVTKTQSAAIDRVGGISSRPWAQIGGMPPPPSLFVDQQIPEAHWHLFQLGAKRD